MKYPLPTLALLLMLLPWPGYAMLERVPALRHLGFLGDSGSTRPSVSEDGRYVVFESDATNLVAGDTEGQTDIFLYDRQSGSMLRVSEVNGTGGNNDSFAPAISADGRYVVFESRAANLVAGDTEGQTDIFLYDRQSGTLQRISEVNGTGGNGSSTSPAISADGRYVVFQSNASNLVAGDNNGQSDIFLYDHQSGNLSRISEVNGTEGNGSSGLPAISADGRYVVFQSVASNLVAGDNNGQFDIFLYDRQSGSMQRISELNGTGGNGYSGSPAISADGRYVVFESDATNLVAGDTNGTLDVLLYEVVSGRLISISAGGNGLSTKASVYGNGADFAVAFISEADNLVPGDNNGLADVFLYRMQGGVPSLQRISHDVNGNDPNGASLYSKPAFFNGGSRLAFASNASNLVAGDINGVADVFLYNPVTQTTGLLHQQQFIFPATANGVSFDAQVSADGRYMVFTSGASNLVAGDNNGRTDVFLYDHQTDTTRRISEVNGTGGNGFSHSPALSADGRYVVFESGASNLVAGDTEGQRDIFLYDRQSGSMLRVSEVNGTGGNDHSYAPAISADGRYVVFQSNASNLVAGDNNGRSDIFLYDHQSGNLSRISEINGTGGDGYSSSPALSADGRYVVFQSDATNLVAGDTEGQTDIFLYDHQSGNLSRISEINGTGGNDASGSPALSADGRYVVFESDASNLVAGDTEGQTDIFLYDRQSGTLQRISEVNGTGGDGRSRYSAISADGRYVVFESNASNLVAGDNNGLTDIFLYDLQSGSMLRISEVNGTGGDGPSGSPAISADGTVVVFSSSAGNLTVGKTYRLVTNVFRYSSEVMFHDSMELP